MSIRRTPRHSPGLGTKGQPPLKVLLIEDDQADARLVEDLLRELPGEGQVVKRVERLHQAIELLNAEGFSAILLDLDLPDSKGLETLVRVHAQLSSAPILVLAGIDDEELAVAVVREGAQDYLVKHQVDGRTLRRAIRYAISRKQAEAHIRWLTMAVDQSPASIFMTDLKGKIQYVNRTFTEITGYSAADAIGNTPSILKSGQTPVGYYRSLWETILAGKTWGSEVQNRRKNGDLYWDLVTISPLRDDRGVVTHFLAVQQDVTGRRQAEEARARLETQLRQAQKMEAVGRLAGGVAHDFNNLLTVILGEADLASQEALPTTVVESIGEIRKAGERAAGLTRQLLAFSRHQVVEMTVFRLNDVVANTDKMLRRLIGEDITVETRLAPETGTIRADRGQVEQVLMNLVVNARDAMPNGGRLLLETTVIESEEPRPEATGMLPPGRYAVLSVTDSGTGMDAETRSHIFEPFFTTKESGKGTGLGLSTVYGIVQQSAGQIGVYSEVGLGTTFRVYFPAAEGEPATVRPAPSPRRARPGAETVLLVEDETAVRRLTRVVLEREGYHVMEAGAPAEALSVADAFKGEIHLMITDVVMPGMGGQDLAARIGPLRPTMRILFTSGYTERAVALPGQVGNPPAFIQKPFTPEELLRKVRRVLDG